MSRRNRVSQERVSAGKPLERRNTCGKRVDEACDFKRLEHIIETKAQDAVKDVDRRLKIIGFCCTVAALAGIPYLFAWYGEKVEQKVTVRFVEGKLCENINDTVPGMIDARFSALDGKMSTLGQRFEENLEKKVSAAEELTKEYNELLKRNLAEANRKLTEANDKLKLFGDIMAAQAGDREAYDRISEMTVLTNEQGRMACDARKTINAKYLLRKMSINKGLFYSLELSTNVLQGLSREYHWTSMAYGDREWNSEGSVIELMRTRDKHNVATLIHVVEKSKYLDSVYTAICGIEKLTGEEFDPLGVEQVRVWWKKNSGRSDFHNGFEKFFDHLENSVGPLRTGETADQYAWRKVLALDEIIKDKPELYPAAVSMIPLAIYNKTGLEQKELRKEILLRAMSIIEAHKDICAQWDVYKTMVLMSTGDGSDAVRFIHSRLKEDATYKTRLQVWPAYSGGFWKAYAEDAERMGLK